MDNPPTHNIVGADPAGNSVLEHPEMGDKDICMQNLVLEKFGAEGLLRQVNISREAEAVCKDIDSHISSME